MRQRDIDALREGIREQERAAINAENTERFVARIFARERVPRVALIRARDLRKGDRLAATDSGQGFYVASTLTKVEQYADRPGSLWIEYRIAQGGTGGSTLTDPAEFVLIEARA